MRPSKHALHLTRKEAVAIWRGWILPEDEERTTTLSGSSIDHVHAHSLLQRIRYTPLESATYRLTQDEVIFLTAVLKEVTRFISYGSGTILRDPQWITAECQAVLGINRAELEELSRKIEGLLG
jgi:hypothetical protein